MSGTHHDPVSIEYIAREVEMYSLTKNEILSLNSGEGEIEISLAGATGGAFISALITVLTVPMSSAGMFASFVACSLVMGILCLYFSFKSFFAVRKLNEQRKRILERNVDSGNLKVVNR